MQAEVFSKPKKILLIDDDRTVITPIAVSQWTEAVEALGHERPDLVLLYLNMPTKEEGWTLNISRYVLPPVREDIPPLPEAVAAFKDAFTEARAAEDQLRTVLTEGGWLE